MCDVCSGVGEGRVHYQVISNFSLIGGAWNLQGYALEELRTKKIFSKMVERVGASSNSCIQRGILKPLK